MPPPGGRSAMQAAIFAPASAPLNSLQTAIFAERESLFCELAIEPINIVVINNGKKDPNICRAIEATTPAATEKRVPPRNHTQRHFHAIFPAPIYMRVAIIHDWLNGMRGGEKV